MGTRAAIRLAWPLWALVVVVCVSSLPIIENRADLIIILPLLAWAVTSSTVGAVVASRHPGNPIGWILWAMGFLWASNIFAGPYAVRALVTDPGSLPAGEVAAWLSTWVVYPAFGLLGYLFLLFPDGRPLSPRWRPLLWINGALIVAGSVVMALTPGRIDGLEGARNPLGIEGYRAGLESAGELLFYAGDLLVLVSVVSVYLRLRRSSGATRRQIEWLVYAAAMLAVVVVVGLVGDLFFGGLGWWVFLLLVLAFLGLPISIGVAMLRYRLYDIDIVINRTLVYGALTATLVAVYFGGVATIQAAFRALTGGEQQPQLAVVASTLLIAALFNPLRRRIQRFIDLRFYRRKYDAAKTLAAFTSRLREETDLEALNDDLVRVVRETIQPKHVSLWLRPHRADAKQDLPG